MIIGEKEKFAAEYNLYDNYSELLDGTFSYWINNKQLGDDTEPIYLSDVLMRFAWINHDNWHRQYSDSVINGNWDKLYNELFKRIYQTDDVGEWHDSPAKFDISVSISNKLGKYTVFYLEDALYGHLLYKMNEDEKVDRFTIRKGFVDDVIAKTYTKLNSLYESVHKNK